MSKYLYIFALSLTCIMLFSSFSSADEVEVEQSVKVTVMVFTKGKKVENAEVRIYERGELIETTHSRRKGKFLVQVGAGSRYIIEVFKAGYFPKRVIINTHDITADIKDIPDLKFEMELLRTKTYKGDTFMMDFPSTLINYDAEKKDFIYSKRYYNSMQRHYEKMKEAKKSK